MRSCALRFDRSLRYCKLGLAGVATIVILRRIPRSIGERNAGLFRDCLEERSSTLSVDVRFNYSDDCLCEDN
jgi:hypothetical protein